MLISTTGTPYAGDVRGSEDLLADSTVIKRKTKNLSSWSSDIQLFTKIWDRFAAVSFLLEIIVLRIVRAKPRDERLRVKRLTGHPRWVDWLRFVENPLFAFRCPYPLLDFTGCGPLEVPNKHLLGEDELLCPRFIVLCSVPANAVLT